MNPAQQTGTIIGACIAIVLMIIADWKLFSKAGVAGWKSLIPIYNIYTLVKIVDGNGIKFLLLCLPIVNIVYGIILNLRMAKAYGKGTGFAIGLILLPNLFQLILAFGSSEYVGPQGKKN
ncbi:MAG: hypothetical protein E7570_01325 [Ruminococcaceae bacterium]|nr:hypothetical protein [Oscillospiraceae bacterium]